MNSFGNILIIGLGGFVGAILRYLVSTFVQTGSGSAIFPYGTLSVNLIGCFFIGFFALLAESRGILTAEARMFLLVGLLGSFTTFSTFSYETMNLLRDGRHFLAGVNITVQVIAGLFCVWLGRVIALLIWK